VSSKSSSKQSLWKEQQNQTHRGKWGGRARGRGVIFGSWQSGCLVLVAVKKAEENKESFYCKLQTGCLLSFFMMERARKHVSRL